MVEIRYQQAEIVLGGQRQKAALLFEGQLILAILVFLEPAQYANDPEIAGKWFVEIGFGACAIGARTVLFDDLDAGLAWALEKQTQSPSP